MFDEQGLDPGQGIVFVTGIGLQQGFSGRKIILRK